jgi:lipoyl(octanoyl) transferase
MSRAPHTICSQPKSIEAYDLGMAPYLAVQQLQSRLRSAVAWELTPGALLLLEHPPVITLGAHAAAGHVRDPRQAARRGVEVVRSERGGQCTLHAPGQLVSYPVMTIPRRDLRAYVHDLEEVLLLLLADEGIRADRVAGSPGLYLQGLKIASVGLRCEHGVTSHGSALNADIDLSLFDLVTSCGDPHIRQTSIKAVTGRTHLMSDIKGRYVEAFQQVFGLTVAPLLALPYHQVESSLGVTVPPLPHSGTTRSMPTAGFEPATPGSGGQCSIP